MESIPKEKLREYTKAYVPLEVIDRRRIIPQKLDAFCFGMTFYIMIKILNKEEPLNSSLYKEIIKSLPDKPYKSIIAKCLNEDPAQSPTFAEIKKEFEYKYPKYKSICD